MLLLLTCIWNAGQGAFHASFMRDLAEVIDHLAIHSGKYFSVILLDTCFWRRAMKKPYNIVLALNRTLNVHSNYTPDLTRYADLSPFICNTRT